MSFVAASQTPSIGALEYTANAETSYTTGKVALRNTSTGEIDEDGGSNEATTVTIECIIAQTATTAASNPIIRAIPILNGSAQLWIADCTNTTAADQLNKAHKLTSATHVANTGTQQDHLGAVFVALKIVGAASDNKLLGYFVKLGQIVS